MSIFKKKKKNSEELYVGDIGSRVEISEKYRDKTEIIYVIERTPTTEKDETFDYTFDGYKILAKLRKTNDDKYFYFVGKTNLESLGRVCAYLDKHNISYIEIGD